MDNRPEVVKEKHLKYLDALRETGVTNMFGARPWLEHAFDNLSKEDASAILKYWMETFGDEDR
jgi:hypothetical protein